LDAGRNCWRLLHKRGIKFLRAGAIPRHSDVEASLNLKALDMAQVGGKSFTIVDEGRDHDSVRPGRRAQLRFLLSNQHI
jgi:hypothetical protein